jgi:hypothetical protein
MIIRTPRRFRSLMALSALLNHHNWWPPSISYHQPVGLASPSH